jgi:hypothetical protein
MFTLYILIDTIVWKREAHTSLRAAMLSCSILRKEGHVAFVVVA